jgi:hypothetical protein
MASMQIKVIGSAALHPQGRGQIERSVGIVKLLLKKALATKSTYNWEFLPYLIAKIYNTTKNLTTNSSPNDLVFGSMEGDSPFMSNVVDPPLPHYMVKNDQTRILSLNEELKSLTEKAQELIFAQKVKTNEYLNKNRVSNPFKAGDIVFHLDTLRVEGQNRSLKTRLSPSPFVVIRPLVSTTLIKRLADGFTALYRNADLKKFSPTNAIFKDLHPTVSRVLRNSFENLINSDFESITKHDPLQVMKPIALLDEMANEENNADDPPTNVNDDNEDLDNTYMPIMSNEIDADPSVMFDQPRESAMTTRSSGSENAPQKVVVQVPQPFEEISDFLKQNRRTGLIRDDVQTLRYDQPNVSYEDENSDEDSLKVETGSMNNQNVGEISPPIRKSVRFQK